MKSEERPREQRGKETRRARRRQPVEIELCVFWSGFRNYGRSAQYGLVQIRNVPAAVCVGWSGGFTHSGLDRRQSPTQYENGENRKWHPGFGNLLRAVLFERTGSGADQPFIAGSGVNFFFSFAVCNAT